MLPLALHVRHKKVLVVGGGAVASRRVRTFLAEGAQVTVVSPAMSRELEQLAESEANLHLEYALFSPVHLAGAWLVLAHTGSPAVQKYVADECEARQIWCLVGGEPERSSFWMLAHRRIQDVVVAVSGGGRPKRALGVLAEIEKNLARPAGDETGDKL